MSFEIINYHKDTLQLKWKDTDVVWLNSLRRIMISEVPSIAIERIVLETNTTSVHDEFLAHRIGLLPIFCQEDMSNIPKQEECSCISGCNLCNFEFLLEKENNMHAPYVGVYSSDFVPVSPSKMKYNIVEYRDNGILLCKLGKGEKIKLRGTACKGIGKEHIKWCPVSVVSYYQEKEEDDHTYIMNIETIGSYKPCQVFQTALSILQEKIEIVKKSIHEKKKVL